jgi:pyruvate,orthophosphate dikinase
MTVGMSGHKEVCRLDYLAGTLATAYKGAVASLVVKDFCMTGKGEAVVFTGTVLSMPAGEYDASLNQNGVELSRSGLRNGHFELQADSGSIAAARELQIDIIQSGRHVGTFLLKKGADGGSYISAAELSKELEGTDLTRLTSPLRGKAGLLHRAEEIVSQIHSTKKNWAAFSEMLYGLAIDMFWSAPDAFYGAFDIVARFLILAAERSGTAEAGKPVSNYFDLLYLPLSQEEAPLRLRSAAGSWMTLLSRSSVDLSALAQRAIAVLRKLHDTCPEVDVADAVRILIASLRGRTSARRFLERRTAAACDGLIPSEARESLLRFGEPGRDGILQKLDEAGKWLENGDCGQALDRIADIDLDVLDDRKTVSALFSLMEKDLSETTADSFADVLGFFISEARDLSEGALESRELVMAGHLDRLISLGRSDICSELFRKIGDIGSPLTEQLMLDPRIARSVLDSGRKQLFEQYERELKKIIIPAARVQGISPDTWAEIVNPLHLERLAKFLELLMSGDERIEGILIRVIANLAVGGVLIPDDRLFQRRISAYLNSQVMKGRFLLNYLLLERLPVYFNEVGATSRIRDYSTELDSWGNDPIIYFLRKQIHVNASSHNVYLLESILRSWVSNDLSALQEVVPPDTYKQAKPALLERYSLVIGPFFRGAGVLDAEGLHLQKLLAIKDEMIEDRLSRADDDNEARSKAGLLCKLYKEIVKKYSLLSRDAAVGNVRARLLDEIAILRELKHIVLSPERTEPRESLYFKRHIAFGIPSVLGTYHEPKFDALSEMMRRAEDIPVLLEAVISEIKRKGTASLQADLVQWAASLEAAWQIQKLYGLQNVLVDEFVEVLGSGLLSLPQTADVLRMWQKELAWMVASLGRTFHGPLTEIIAIFPADELPPRLGALGASAAGFPDRAADIIMRDILSSIPGLVETDRLLESLAGVLRARSEITGDSEGERKESPRVQRFYDIHALSRQDARRLAPELGSKAKNLVPLRDRGLSIPAGVVLPAQDAEGYQADSRQAELLQVLQEAVRTIERRTGSEFGGTGKPLFLSVRSGSYPSMPGILSSILYCGMNAQTLQAFIRNTGKPGLGWDSYRRFIEHYGIAVLGLDAEFFERIVQDNQHARARIAGGPQDVLSLRTIVGLYIEKLRMIHLAIPQDVYEQLRQCVRAVSASWYSERARQFRSTTGISERWGTSVMLMEMVSGNQEEAGVSMFYTRDPHTLERIVYGETREGACGDDLASGRKTSGPLSRVQEAEGEHNSLEQNDPELYQLHQDLARTIEDAFDGLPQEVEVTYERGATGRTKLYVLQTRRMEQGEAFSRMFDELCRMDSRVIGSGTGASGGALSGVASFAESPDQLETIKNKFGRPVILLRKTANTDDVPLMPAVGGIITAAGGVTSHAVVLAQKFGISAVVGCADMKLGRDEQGRPYALIGTALVKEGTFISMDGTTGLVFSGECFMTSTRRRPL